MRTRLWLRVLAGWTAAVLGACAVEAATAVADWRCVLCGHQGDEGEAIFTVKDLVEQQDRTLCQHCNGLKPVCFLCTLPIPKDARDLLDGRFLCPRDAAVAVVDPAQAQGIGQEAHRALARVASRFFSVPEQRVAYVLEDQRAMARAAAGVGRSCAYPYLRVASERGTDGTWSHTIGLLSGQPRSWLALEVVHGLAHTVLAESVSASRELSPQAVEAFCDLVAWLTAEELGLAGERRRLEASRVTDDQTPLFLNAYRTFDLQVVLDWMRYGQGARLVEAEPDRIRALDPQLLPAKRGEAQVIPPTPAARERADRLMLTGIVGQGQRRLALVSGVTLAEGERGRVRLASGAMDVRCVKIQSDSVVLEVVATGEQVELKLKAAE